MKAKNFTQIKLKEGEVYLYDFGDIKLHAYKSNDPLHNLSFLLEKEGFGVVLEPQSFRKNIADCEKYVKDSGICVVGLVLAYHHSSGGNFLKDIKKYSSKERKIYGPTQNVKKIVRGLSRLFSADFDKTESLINYYIDHDQKLTIGGIRLNAFKTTEGLDLEIPEINGRYIHMFSAQSHSLLYSIKEVEEKLKILRSCITKRYAIILSSHDLPNGTTDIKKKISYLETLRKVALRSSSAKEFKTEMIKLYPDFECRKFLDVTAKFLFSKK